jgi:prepilin-type N-terminal cleavage/methylation domain-containing protein
MMKHTDSKGFTLVETVLVMAITGLMLVFIWAGQRELRDRARFDTAVDQAVANINYARSYARTGVNQEGTGDNPSIVNAGAGIELDDAQTPAFDLEELEPVYANMTASGDIDMTTLANWPPGEPPSACPNSWHPSDPNKCRETFFNLGDTDLQVTNAQHVAIYFINTGGGNLKICRDVGTVYMTVAAACAVTGGAPIIIDLEDTQSGYTSTISVDAYSGIAQRLN